MRTWILTSLALAGLVAPAALAADAQSSSPAPAAEASPATEEADEEVIVISDKFARWDHTRWYAEMQIGFPLPFNIFADRNQEFRATAMQVRANLYCEKTWKRGKHQFEVLCDVEDVSLRATTYEVNPKDADGTLQYLDDRLTAAKIRLYVSDDGRVDNIDFEEYPANNDREKVSRESMRQVFLRLLAMFHMKLPRNATLREGQWVEYNSPMFLLPANSATNVTAGGSPSSTIDTTAFTSLASLSGSMMVHQLDKYKGHLVVQSVGEASISDGSAAGSFDADDANVYSCKYNGVSIYNEDGIMTERVYALSGFATASSAVADGFGGSNYFQSGRMRMLGETEKVDVGFTGRVSPPRAAAQPGVPRWVNLE